MVRKVVSATVSAALCMLSVAPGAAVAQDYRYTGYDAPRGATATVNLRIPLGMDRRPVQQRMSFGLTLGYGQATGATLDGRTTTRAVNLADFRFNTEGELRNARLASFDLANFDRDRRFNLAGPGKKTWLILGAIVVAGVVICVAADCFEDDDSEDGDSPGTQ